MVALRSLGAQFRAIVPGFRVPGIQSDDTVIILFGALKFPQVASHSCAIEEPLRMIGVAGQRLVIGGPGTAEVFEPGQQVAEGGKFLGAGGRGTCGIDRGLELRPAALRPQGGGQPEPGSCTPLSVTDGIGRPR